MADTSRTRYPKSRPPPLHPPKRTLSSSLRSYTNPSASQGVRRSNTLATFRIPSVTSEANENDPLLGTSPRTRPIDNSTVPDAYLDQHGEDDPADDVDLEADPSDEQADSDGLYPPHSCWTLDGSLPPKRGDPFSVLECEIFRNIHRIRNEIISSIDDPYSLEQLKAPRMNVTVVRPLVDKFYSTQDLSMVYCLLLNRVQFIREQSYAVHHQTVNLTRALLCELVAEKVLRRYNEYNPGPLGLLKLAHILVAGFEPFQGASDEIVNRSSHATHWAHQRKAGHYVHKLNALEIAIVSESKSFLASIACQKVVDAIYRGKVVYSPSSFVDIIPDRWKRRPISLYDPRRAPILNQYRLVVPRTRNWLEVLQFVLLLILYMIVMAKRETRRTTTYEAVEVVFQVYSMGWVLDQLCSILEHGWHVYTQNLWAFLDIIVGALFVTYFSLRMRGLAASDQEDGERWAIAALDVLSCGAPFLLPRLAFNIMSENMLFLSLRAMMGDFVTLTLLAIWCFAGFLLSLKWLHNGLHQSLTISKWMIWIWFGLDGTGIDQAYTFHPYLGPALMIAFAFLGNTLFLTVLVSILSNTFSMVSANAVQEIQYRRAVLTFMGVKSDALFAYMPPFNLAALFILGPMKWVLTPRMFHTVNVFMVRVVNLPTLVVLSLYERKTLWVSSRFRHVKPRKIDWKNPTGPRVVTSDWWPQTLQFWDFSRFSAHSDIQTVFEYEPSVSALFDGEDSIEDESDDHKPAIPLSRRRSKIQKAQHMDISTPEMTEAALINWSSPRKKATNRLQTSLSSSDDEGPRTARRARTSDSNTKRLNEAKHESQSKSRPRSKSRPERKEEQKSKTNGKVRDQSPTQSKSRAAKLPKFDAQKHQKSVADALTNASLRKEFVDSEDESYRSHPQTPKPALPPLSLTRTIPRSVPSSRRHSDDDDNDNDDDPNLLTTTSTITRPPERPLLKSRVTGGTLTPTKTAAGGTGTPRGTGQPQTTAVTAYRKIRKPQRKDSLIDYEDFNAGSQEANARLISVEERLERIESLLESLYSKHKKHKSKKAESDDDDDDDDDDGDNEDSGGSSPSDNDEDTRSDSTATISPPASGGGNVNERGRRERNLPPGRQDHETAATESRTRSRPRTRSASASEGEEPDQEQLRREIQMEFGGGSKL